MSLCYLLHLVWKSNFLRNIYFCLKIQEAQFNLKNKAEKMPVTDVTNMKVNNFCFNFYKTIKKIVF